MERGVMTPVTTNIYHKHANRCNNKQGSRVPVFSRLLGLLRKLLDLVSTRLTYILDYYIPRFELAAETRVRPHVPDPGDRPRAAPVTRAAAARRRGVMADAPPAPTPKIGSIFILGIPINYYLGADGGAVPARLCKSNLNNDSRHRPGLEAWSRLYGWLAHRC